MIRTAVLVVCLCAGLSATDASSIWLDVPFVKQEKNGCGAASIAMVMQFWEDQQRHMRSWGSQAANIQLALFSNAAHGIYASDAERYFRQNGYRTFVFRGEWADLRQHLEKGRPLIVALNPGSSAPLHFVVVTGLDWERGLVLMNDPAMRKLVKEERSRFEREWNAAGSWTLLALPQADSH